MLERGPEERGAGVEVAEVDEDDAQLGEDVEVVREVGENAEEGGAGLHGMGWKIE